MLTAGSQMHRFIEGYRQFRANRWPAERVNFAELAKGQSPESLVIACSDSRVDPAVIFSAKPGELFIIRNVANIVPPYEPGGGYHGTSAALAFAVLVAKVRTIMVLGHAQCGGIAAAMQDRKSENIPFISEWIALLSPALTRVNRHDSATLERECVRLSLERLLTFPFIDKRVKAGTLELVGAHFGIADGQLELLDPSSGEFVAVTDR
jgi:carbonic anhydrase